MIWIIMVSPLLSGCCGRSDIGVGAGQIGAFRNHFIPAGSAPVRRTGFGFKGARPSGPQAPTNSTKVGRNDFQRGGSPTTTAKGASPKNTTFWQFCVFKLRKCR
ncbi:uncharacterized protein LOC132286720 [Cornus florida]|uniref:uncharacterized protein LOC132286720 n=1 Tax=Cornus florida TaxID=4283 RepID=UPI00289D4E0E|nr:uncharacterized protein LOC132286720 [Cornus florida]